MSSGASSSSSPPVEAGDGDGDGYWTAREEAAARLEAMAARALEEDELSAEQLETNNQLQADEVMYRAPPSQLLVSLFASPWRAGNRWIICGILIEAKISGLCRYLLEL